MHKCTKIIIDIDIVRVTFIHGVVLVCHCMHAAGDLHLAATVGKMLLEKNGELEEKLTRLQQVAEQTAQENEASLLVP